MTEAEAILRCQTDIEADVTITACLQTVTLSIDASIHACAVDFQVISLSIYFAILKKMHEYG